MVFFNLGLIALEAANELKLVDALFPLSDIDYLNALESEQLSALTGLSLEAYGYGFGVSLIFFAFICLLFGYLIIKSGYIPRTIGIIIQIASLSYLTNSFALLLAPVLAEWLFPAVLIPAFIGEASLCLWLLFKGVNVAVVT